MHDVNARRKNNYFLAFSVLTLVRFCVPLIARVTSLLLKMACWRKKKEIKSWAHLAGCKIPQLMALLEIAFYRGGYYTHFVFLPDFSLSINSYCYYPLRLFTLMHSKNHCACKYVRLCVPCVCVCESIRTWI